MNRFNYVLKVLLVFLVPVMLLMTSCSTDQNSTKQLSIKEKKANTSKSTKKNNRTDKTTLRVCQSENPPGSLDPIFFVTKRDQITRNIFDSLVKLNNKGEVINELAESITMPDKLTVKIKIKEGIKFHNGEPLKAGSVKLSIDRLIDTKQKTSTHYLLKNIAKVEVVDDYKLILHLKKPDSLVVNKLAFVRIIPEKYFKEIGVRKFGKKPVGTSAYKFDKWLDDGTIILTRNENYWAKEKPAIKTIVFKFIETNNLSRKEQLDALFNAEVDLITELPGIHTLKVQQNPDTKLIKDVYKSTVFKMSFNSSKKPFSSIDVRKAVNLAINRNLLIKILAKGNGRKLATPITSLQFGYNDQLKPYKFDINEAKRLLKKAGYTELSIKMIATEEAELVARAVIKELERINIKTKLDIVTKEKITYLLAKSKMDKSVVWDYDIDIYHAVDRMLHAGYIYEEALYSQGAWSTTNEKSVDEIVEKLQNTFDKEEQRKLCHKLEEMVHENYWYTPVFQVIGTYGAADDLYFKEKDASYLDLKHAYFKE